MAITNQERVGKAMELLRAGLAAFVEREAEAMRNRATAHIPTSGAPRPATAASAFLDPDGRTVDLCVVGRSHPWPVPVINLH